MPYSVGLKVENGKPVRKGEPITDGALNPHDVLRISGVEAVQNYLTQGVLAVYRQQGVDINDKHIEVIIRQMMRKVRVEDPGDTIRCSAARSSTSMSLTTPTRPSRSASMPARPTCGLPPTP